MVSNLQALIAERLKAADAQRVRQQSPWVFLYTSPAVSGEIAIAPNAENARVVRKCNIPDQGVTFYAYSEYELNHLFEARTVKTGPNVRRWL